MSSYGWAGLIGTAIGPGYRLDALIRAEFRTAAFTARNATGHDGSELLVLALRGTPEEAELYLRRCLEAKFLRHPNLITVLDAGMIDSEGQNIVFVVTEPATTSLLSYEPLDHPTLWRVASDVVAGLGYLHSEDLVYCALRAETIWLVSRDWKLGDYHQLRLIGTGRAAETRALMGRMPEVPPEAFEGIVSPAWDVWALGVTLGKVLRKGAGDRRSAPLPEPFDAIVNRCLDPNPDTRITIPELAEKFSRPLVGAEVPAAAAPVYTLTPAPPRLHPSTRRPAWVPLGIAGAIAGTALTLFAIKHDDRPKQTAAVTSVSDPSQRPAAVKPNPENSSDSQEADRINTANPEQRIRELMDRWVQAVRTRNIDEQIACYAPVVDTFYGRHGINTGQLRTEKERQFGSIGSIRRFDVSDVRIRKIGSGLATVSFKKDWDFGSFAGSERGEFVVRAVHGAWKIASERGQKVYWVRRGRSTGDKAPS